MSCDHRIKTYYQLLDQFMEVQLDFAMERGPYQHVIDQHRELIDYLKNVSFEEEEIENGRLEKLRSLKGVESRLICSVFSSPPRDESELTTFLEKGRSTVDKELYLKHLRNFKMFKFLNTNIEEPYEKWLIENNNKISGNINCLKMKDLLFEISGFKEEEGRIYHFEESPVGKGFYGKFQ
jgi:DNA-directed RNA polymerase subunit F